MIRYGCKGPPEDFTGRTVIAVRDDDAPSAIHCNIHRTLMAFAAVKTAFMFRNGSTHLARFNEALNRVHDGIATIKRRYKLPFIEVHFSRNAQITVVSLFSTSPSAKRRRRRWAFTI